MYTISPHRIAVQDCIHLVCENYDGWRNLPEAERNSKVRQMERSCFRLTVESCTNDGIDRLFTEKKFLDRYSLHTSRVLANLNAGTVNSNYLVKHITDGQIEPKEVANLSSIELCPDASLEIRNEIEKRKKVKFENKVSRSYTCRKCGGNETIPIEFQSRCADEGSSISIKCVHCEYVWRK